MTFPNVACRASRAFHGSPALVDTMYGGVFLASGGRLSGGPVTRAALRARARIEAVACLAARAFLASLALVGTVRLVV